MIMCCNDTILDEIESQRLKMIRLADEKGFTHHETVHVSQNLDVLLNRYRFMSAPEK